MLAHYEKERESASNNYFGVLGAWGKKALVTNNG